MLIHWTRRKYFAIKIVSEWTFPFFCVCSSIIHLYLHDLFQCSPDGISQREYEWKLWLRTTFSSSAVASFSSSLKLVIIRYESFHSVHYALRRRRPDKLNIFLAQGEGNEREIYGDSMRTSIKLIVMVVTLWADYLLLLFFFLFPFCWWQDENSFRAFHHRLHPKVGKKDDADWGFFRVQDCLSHSRAKRTESNQQRYRRRSEMTMHKSYFYFIVSVA